MVMSALSCCTCPYGLRSVGIRRNAASISCRERRPTARMRLPTYCSIRFICSDRTAFCRRVDSRVRGNDNFFIALSALLLAGFPDGFSLLSGRVIRLVEIPDSSLKHKCLPMPHSIILVARSMFPRVLYIPDKNGECFYEKTYSFFDIISRVRVGCSR